MGLFRKIAARSVSAGVCLLVASGVSAAQRAQVERVRVLNAGPKIVEVEIATTQPIVPQTQEVSDPTRLVVDFPQATPGPLLRALGVNHAEVKGVRVGLFSTQPPTTRVVFDLNGPVNYRIFPSGRTIIVKLGGEVEASSSSESATPATPPAPKVAVTFQNGLLSVHSDRGNLAEVLNEIHNRTGAEIAVPSGAEQEPAFVDLGPAPAKEVLNALLQGTPYNFILIGSSSDPNAIERVLLSNKGTDMVVDVGNSSNGAPQSDVPPTTIGGRLIPTARPAVQPQPDPNEIPADDEPQPGDPQVNGQQPPPQN